MTDHEHPFQTRSSATANSLLDLMTSLAMIFLLLFIAALAPTPPHAQEPPPQPALQQPPQVSAHLSPTHTLRDEVRRMGVTVDEDPEDPLLLHVTIPDRLVHFEFGQSTVSPDADRFLRAFIPRYAIILCHSIGNQADSVVIEGHTDDLGGDVVNLKLSQARSFQVMVRSLEILQESAPHVAACFQRLTSASGRGKQDVVYWDSAHVDRERSRRVVFKIRLRPDGALRRQAEHTARLAGVGSGRHVAAP